MTITHRLVFFLALALALAGLAACRDSATPPDPDGAAVEDPAFLVATRVWDASSTTSYLHVVPSLEPGTTIDLRNALEVPGSAKLYAIPSGGWFALGGGEAPTITQYTLDGGRFVKGTVISLQNYGIASLWPTLYVVSATKAYYPDREGRQLIVLNLTTMEITGSIPLPQTARTGFLSLYGYTPILRGDRLLFSVGWFDWQATDSIRPETGLVVIDTITDTVARFDTDPRCGGITETIVTPSGDAYYVSSALAGAAHRLGRLSTEPCALRVPAGADAFDPSYHVRLGDLGAGAVAGEPVPGGGNAVFLRAFDETIATVQQDDATWELTGQAAWRWWRWDVSAGTAARVEALAPATADVLWFQVDGRVFGAQTKPDYSETTLVELTADGGPRPALTAPGFLHGLARVR
jgi:hypothetical protein